MKNEKTIWSYLLNTKDGFIYYVSDVFTRVGEDYKYAPVATYTKNPMFALRFTTSIEAKQYIEITGLEKEITIQKYRFKYIHLESPYE